MGFNGILLMKIEVYYSEFTTHPFPYVGLRYRRKVFLVQWIPSRNVSVFDYVSWVPLIGQKPIEHLTNKTQDCD